MDVSHPPVNADLEALKIENAILKEQLAQWKTRCRDLEAVILDRVSRDSGSCGLIQG